MAEKMKTGIENLLDDHLQGLILPAESSTFESMVFWIIGMLLVTTVFLFWKWNKHNKKPRQIAKRKLKALNVSLSNKSRSDLAIQLTSILQKGLETPRLETYKPSNAKQWKVFTEELETASYSSNKPSKADLENLLKQSFYWLRQT